MATIKEVVRNALIRIQKNGQIATPEVYQEAFCEEAKKLNIDVSQYNWRLAWIRKLDAKTRAQMQNFPIKTQIDFIGFLVATVARLNAQDNKEQMGFYREMLSMFLRHYALMHPQNNHHALIKETKECLEGNSSINASAIRDRWFHILKEDTPKEGGSEANNPVVEYREEREKNLSFVTPLLRPSLTALSPAHTKIQKAYNMLHADLQGAIKERLADTIQDAVVERLRIDQALLDAMLQKRNKDLGKILSVVMAKVASMQLAGEMIFDKITQDKETLHRLPLKANDMAGFKSSLLSLLTSTQDRFTHIKDSLTMAKEGIDKVASSMAETTAEADKAKKSTPKHAVDSLTGVYNMEGVQEIVDYQEELYGEYQQSYSVFFVDIDRFRRINENYGKESGDKILATFGKLLKKIVREQDCVARYDGEEFLVILSGMDHFDSAFFAEKIRSQIEESVFVYGQNQMKITVSIGVADRKEGCFPQIVEIAKERMQRAKQQGYNTIVS